MKDDVGSPGVDGQVGPTGPKGQRGNYLDWTLIIGNAEVVIVCHCAYTSTYVASHYLTSFVIM